MKKTVFHTTKRYFALILTLVMILSSAPLGGILPDKTAFAADPNVALNKPATANSTYGADVASCAVDSDTNGTWWQSNSGAPAPWEITVDLGSNYSLSGYYTKQTIGGILTAYDLYTSLDGVNYTLADSMSGNSANEISRPLTSPKARYVKLSITQKTSYNVYLADFEVYGVPALDENRLSGISLSSGTVSPAFSMDTTAYTTFVYNNVSGITVTPISASPLATVTVNGILVNRGSASGAIPLTVGDTGITIVVTPQSGTAKTYTIVARRFAPNLALNKPATANSIYASDIAAYAVDSYTSGTWWQSNSGAPAPWEITIDLGSNYKLNGYYTKQTLSGRLNAYNLYTSLNGVDYTLADSMSGNNDSEVGRQLNVPLARYVKLSITQKTSYNVYLDDFQIYGYVPSSNANLSGLSLSVGALSPAFASDITSYTAIVATSVASMTVTPTGSDMDATIKVNNVSVPNGQPSEMIDLAEGSNTITVAVSAPDETLTKTYTIQITREAAPTPTPSPTPTPEPTAEPTPTPVPTYNITVSVDDTKGMVINKATGLAVKNGEQVTLSAGGFASFKVVAYGGYKIDEVIYNGGAAAGTGMFNYSVNTGAITAEASLIVTFGAFTPDAIEIDTYDNVFVATENSNPIAVSYGTVHGWQAVGECGIILWDTAATDVTLNQALANPNDAIHVFSVTSGPLAKGVNSLGQFGAKVINMPSGNYKAKTFAVIGSEVRYGDIVTFTIA